MVRPLPDAPFSARQVEEREQALADGTEAKRLLICQVYRDSAGRVRMEWSLEEGDRIVHLFDPVADLTIVLLPEQKIAHRDAVPRSGSAEFQTGLPVAWTGGALPVGEWKEQALGVKIIEGVEGQGTRWVHPTKEHPTPTASLEKWSSEVLGLILEQRLVGPNWKHTLRLQSIKRGQQDPALFVVPGDYTVQGQ